MSVTRISSPFILINLIIAINLNIISCDKKQEEVPNYFHSFYENLVKIGCQNAPLRSMAKIERVKKCLNFNLQDLIPDFLVKNGQCLIEIGGGADKTLHEQLRTICDNPDELDNVINIDLI